MREDGKMQRLLSRTVLVAMAVFCMILTGCKEEKDATAKLKDLEFTVIAEENIPEPLLAAINEKKEAGFKLTYQDAGFLYICVGYGQQATGGYSIAVNALYETENAVYFDTTLLGPEPGQNADKKHSPSYPYAVVKTEFIDKPVVFE